MEVKKCTCCKEEKDVDNFALVNDSRWSSQCKDCLNKKARKRAKKHKRVKKVSTTDGDLANELTKMRWRL